MHSPDWPWPQVGSHTGIGGSVPEGKHRLSQQPLSIKANVEMLREVVTIVPAAWVLAVSSFRNGEEVL
jgi:hypothetical protein